MSDDDKRTMEERLYALEKKIAERDAVMAYIANVTARLSATLTDAKPFSDCEQKCLKIDDTKQRLDCMLKCIADGK